MPIRKFCQLGALSVLAGLALAGCAGRVGPAPQLAQSDPDLTGSTPPDLGLIAPSIAEAFKSTKLSGYPRVSPLRPAPVSSLGDWMVCLTNDQDGDAPVYAVFIRNGAVVDTRLAVVIDACANDTFAPLPSR